MNFHAGIEKSVMQIQLYCLVKWQSVEINILYFFCFERYISLTNSMHFITQAADICYK